MGTIFGYHIAKRLYCAQIVCDDCNPIIIQFFSFADGYNLIANQRPDVDDNLVDSP